MAQSDLFPVLTHQVEMVDIDQRAHDGYINATALCQAAGKKMSHYLDIEPTKAFLTELERSAGIPAHLLIHKIKVGPNRNRGTWVHPLVAISLGQWASPVFAVSVSKWVVEWMAGGAKPDLPYHIRRYMINRHKIPLTHFSMLEQLTLKLLAGMEESGFTLPEKMMPDAALGKMFSKSLRENGHDPDSFPTYEHVFDDKEKRRPVQARLYPNSLLSEFNEEFSKWLTDGRAVTYFEKREPLAIEPLKEVISDLLALPGYSESD